MPKDIKPARRVSVDISAPLQGVTGDEARPPSAVYAYSAGGRLLGQAELDAKGRAALVLGLGADATGVRLLAGPASDDKTPDLQDLLRRGAQERHLRIDADLSKLKVEIALPIDVWRPWLNRCLVKGTLNKRVVRDGITVDMPVCHATVEIYEVDPVHVILPKIPKDLLDRLRDVILGRIPWPEPDPTPGPFPGPFPEPVPGPFPGPFPGPDPLPLLRAMPMQRAAASALPGAARVESASLIQDVASTSTLRLAASSFSDLAFRQSLIDHAVLVRPLLCWLHPQLVSMQRVGTAVTDDCGHFRTTIFKSIFNPDQPDLYFKATQRLFGFLTVTILAPTPVACHTWWNYVCGTEVALHTSHPLAITCAPCPPIVAGDNWVLFMAIGNHPLSRIHGTGQALGAPTASNLGLTDGGAPWGGTLRPRLEFDSALRDSLGVRYYRLSWKRDGEPASAYKPLGADIGRHYAHMVGTDLVLDAYPLGPNTVGGQGNLFEIPPAVPPLGQWSQPDVVEDTASGKFDTVAADGTPVMDGRVQMRVELFDAAGAPVDIGALGIRYFVPTSTDLSGTVHTVDASTLGLVVGHTMVITLRVNNEPCSASIAPPAIGGGVADPCCGVLSYAPTDTVTLGWSASHPHGFGSYGFGIVRGVNGVFSAGGAVSAAAFSATRTVDQLLNDNLPPGCAVGGCPVAGFSENLHVWASATNGWSRQSQYDRHDVRAFVLAPS